MTYRYNICHIAIIYHIGALHRIAQWSWNSVSIYISP